MTLIDGSLKSNPIRVPEPPAPWRRVRDRCSRYGVAIVGLMFVHTILLAWAAYRDSPTLDEVGHFAAGITHWQHGNFNLYLVNPPLVRLVACAPVSLVNPSAPTGNFDLNLDLVASHSVRPEFMAGEYLASSLGPRYFRLLTLARWACIPFSLLGGLICLLWAKDLYGKRAGLLALTLWTTCPNIIGYGHLISPDVGASAVGAAAVYAFWRWLRRPAWANALLAGLLIGLTELTKSTWLILYPLLPLCWLIYRSHERWLGPPKISPWRPAQLLTSLLLSLWVLNAGYVFEGSFKRLGDYRFLSEALGGSEQGHDHDEIRNRFAGTALARVPVPFPENYVRGVDFQRMEFERKLWSFLRGEWRAGGWWYYYFYAMSVKIPTGTLFLIAMTAAFPLYAGRKTLQWSDEFILLLPLVGVLAVVSSQTGFNHHLRYVLPAFPFLFVWVAKLGQLIERRYIRSATLVLSATLWSVLSSLNIYPHSLSYFNELAGGPLKGHYLLSDSNVDWGQDMFYLKEWFDRHPVEGPLYISERVQYLRPAMFGLRAERVRFGFAGRHPGAAWQPAPEDRRVPLEPGWYALSVDHLHRFESELGPFLNMTPVGMAGYSIYIYHLSPADADRLRTLTSQKGAPPDGAATQPAAR